MNRIMSRFIFIYTYIPLLQIDFVRLDELKLQIVLKTWATSVY
jgi:hypothetical protein